MIDETSRRQLQGIPSIDALLHTEAVDDLRKGLGTLRVAELARRVTQELRVEIKSGVLNPATLSVKGDREALLHEAVRRLELAASCDASSGLRRVINATGVVLHTNLGRAPLSEEARRAVSREAAGYCTLEYSLEEGARGRRGERVEDLLVEVTGAEAAVVVNNCAAATLLTLAVLARDGETIISRGELVEIGGDFRIPDVMAQSGTTMIEIGTTNRTRLCDYEGAVNQRTRLILRVHPSNYRIVGFTAAPPLSELANLAHDRGVPLFEDAGSGALIDLGSYGLRDEPIVQQSIFEGADLVAFSGDKLLGAGQAGIVVGRRTYIDQLRRHPFYRALRADKLALAALEATLNAYRRGTACAEVPVLHMLALTQNQIESRARMFFSEMEAADLFPMLRCELIEGTSAIGGGSAPTVHPSTVLLALTHESLSADQLERALRLSDPPLIGRVAEGKVLLDLRTVKEDEESEMLQVLAGVQSKSARSEL
ncbi:MAG TPA: L-seryl-tRNA(Sec) selenium transferase [Pyrinomonadaceae bacterium]|nr:L-seryl-tRNA(Sec) selenium transferase [Pyrinomonadaceae bacterium]